jgi:hypothetical protein
VTHVDDLARPSLDADVSVLSEGGTLHTGNFEGIVIRSKFECKQVAGNCGLRRQIASRLRLRERREGIDGGEISKR